MLKRLTRSAGPWLLAAILVLAVHVVRPGDAEFSDREGLTALTADTETGDALSFQLDAIAVSEALSIDGSVDVASELVPQPAAGASTHLARAWPYGRGLNDVLIGPMTEGPAGLTSTEGTVGPAVPV